MPVAHASSPTPRSSDALGALVVLLFSAPGLLFSAYLTIAKLDAQYGCRPVALYTCSGACSVTLRDAWSEVFGLPLTVYSAALYAVTAGLALIVCVWRDFARWSRLALLSLSSLGLLACAALAVHAALGLGTFCESCSLLYAASAAIFLGACLLARGGVVRDLASGLGDSTSIAVMVAAAIAGSSLILLQNRLYRRAAREALAVHGLTCEELRLEGLPRASVLLDSEGPAEVTALMFVDLACTHCRAHLQQWRALHDAHGDYLRVLLLHFSTDPACGGRFDTTTATRNASCAGARALECLTARGAADRLRAAEALFALQDGPSPFFADEHLRAVGEALGASDLLECVQADDAALQSVRHHIRFGEHHGVHETPVVMLVPTRGEQILGRARRLPSAAPDDAVTRALEAARETSRNDAP